MRPFILQPRKAVLLSLGILPTANCAHSFDVILSGPSLSSPKSLTTRAVPASCDTTINPACLQALYGIPTTAATQSSNLLAVSGFIGQFAEFSDLKTFLADFRPGLTSTFTVETLDGGLNTQGSGQGGIEAVSNKYIINRIMAYSFPQELGHSVHCWCGHKRTHSVR